MIRMWMVDPRIMCTRHLCQEHCEIHRLVANLRKGRNVRKYLLQQVIDISSIYARHEEIEDEIIARGGKLDSPLSAVECVAFARWYGSVTINMSRSLSDLSSCCKQCQKKIGKFVYIAPNNEREMQ
jgi:hypothetical protein